MFLETLRSNFASYKHLFPTGYPIQVKYAVSFPNTWNNNPDLTQSQTDNMHSSEWVSNLQEAMDPSLVNVQLFMNKLHMMYGDQC